MKSVQKEVVTKSDRRIKRSLVMKSNELSMAAHSLSLWAYRAIDMGISVYAKEGEPKVRFEIKELLAQIGSKNRNVYSVAKEIATELQTMALFVETEIAGRKQFVSQPFVRRATYDDKQGALDLEFDTDSLHLLCHPDEEHRNFTLYYLDEAHQFASGPTEILFGLLATHAYAGKYKDSVLGLRKRLQVSDGMYPRFGNLNQRVIQPMVDKINASGIFFISKIRYYKNDPRDGRIVTDVEFIIAEDNRGRYLKPSEKRAPVVIDAEPESHTESEAADLLRNLDGVSFDAPGLKSALDAAREHAEIRGVSVFKIIDSNIHYVQRSKNEGVHAGYYIKSIKEDWGLSLREAAAKEAKQRQMLAENEAIMKEIQDISDEMRVYKEKASLDWIQNTSPENREILLESVIGNPLLTVSSSRKEIKKRFKSLDDVLALEGESVYIGMLYEALEMMESEGGAKIELEVFAKDNGATDGALKMIRQMG